MKFDDGPGSGEEGVDYTYWRGRREKATALQEELKLAQIEGTLVKADDVKKEWERILRLAREHFEAVPERLAERSPTVTDSDKTLLQRLIAETLERLVDSEDDPV